MKFRVPVVYTARVIPKKARTEREVLYGEWTEVEVREVSDIEAPVALAWQDTRFQPSGVDGVCERRWFADAFWEPYVFHYSGKPNEHVTVETLQHWTEQGWSYSPLIRDHDWKVRELVEGRARPLDEAELRVVASSEREAAFEKLLSAADSLIAVDGMLWQRTHEPVYKATRSGGFSGTYYRIEIGAPPRPEERQEGVFRADRFDDVAAWMLDKWGHELDEDDEFSRITVLLPECLRYDDEMPSLVSALRSAVEADAGHIGEKDRDTIIAWVDMRDAVRLLEEDRSPATVDAAVAAAEAWLEVASSYDFYKDSLRAALDRWHSRPIAFDDGAEKVSMSH